jgi:hypothetical protein
LDILRRAPDLLSRALADPRRVLLELNRFYHTRGYRRSYNPTGVDVFARDWDNLIILDACRYDVFAEVVDEFDLPGDLAAVTSRGAASKEFIRANFGGRELHDTMVVTGNSYYQRLADEIDLDPFKLVQFEHDDVEAITQRLLSADEEYPDKRLVGHYIPPHIPYVGPTAAEQMPDPDESWDLAAMSRKYGVPDNVFRRAYRENLERVLPDVERLLSGLSGKTVVTADHAELLGHRIGPIPVAGYGHPTGIYHPELVTVPWLEHTNGPRKEPHADPPEPPEISTDEVERQLRELGYVN